MTVPLITFSYDFREDIVFCIKDNCEEYMPPLLTPKKVEDKNCF